MSRQSLAISMASERLRLAATVVEDRMNRITDHLAGHPRSVSYSAPSTQLKPWCWDHERAVNFCHDAGMDCDGEVVGWADPTGDAAVGSDSAAADLRRLKKAIDAALRTSNEIVDILAKYPDRANLTDLDLTELAALNEQAEPGCALCARVPAPGHTNAKPGARGVPVLWNEVHRTTDFGGLVPEAIPVCSAHYQRVRRGGGVPSAAETARWRDSGKWPPITMAPSAAS